MKCTVRNTPLKNGTCVVVKISPHLHHPSRFGVLPRPTHRTSDSANSTKASSDTVWAFVVLQRFPSKLSSKTCTIISELALDLMGF
jgi:hypothetical protein